MDGYRISTDCRLIRNLLKYSQEDLATQLDITTVSLNRLENGLDSPSKKIIEDLYAFAYRNPTKNLRLNILKRDFYKETYHSVLFHGSKSGIEGEISPHYSSRKMDFGPGFYCGEGFEQASSFIAAYPEGSVYVYEAKEEGLDILRFDVTAEWMLTIIYFRGQLEKYKGHPILGEIERKVSSADVIIAPIADNLMYEVMRDFARGLLSDEAAMHALSASSLGYQHVYKSEKATKSLQLLERLYLSAPEKKDILERRGEERGIALDKVTMSRELYRRKGRYIEEYFL